MTIVGVAAHDILTGRRLHPCGGLHLAHGEFPHACRRRNDLPVLSAAVPERFHGLARVLGTLDKAVERDVNRSA
jgi:hypothetical protein